LYSVVSAFSTVIRESVSKAPFMYIAICTIVGVLFQQSQEIVLTISVSCVLIACVTVCVFTCSKLYPHIQLLFCYAWFFVFGIILPSFHVSEYDALFKYNHIIGTLITPCSEKEKTYAFEIETHATDTNTSSRAQIYIQKDEKSAALQYGDIIEAHAFFKPIENFGDSLLFNYKEFMSEKHIYSSAYIPSDSWMLRDSNMTFTRMGFLMQKRAFHYFKQSNISEQSLAIIYALAFGNKSLLPANTKQAFASSGAMHVLAVSGLHVGIVSSILLFLCMPLRHARWNIVRMFLAISGIWFYACIAGMSPSVQRAAIMFSMLSVGVLLKRRVSSYNTISAAAFISILIDPFAFYNVSFQLSYVAVLSILYGVPKLQTLFYSKNKIIQYVWGIIAVSIAVQIGTFPISIFYFKQIPLFSIFTNICVIPLAFIIIATVFACFIPGISKILFFLLEKEITFLHSIVSYIHEIPKSTIAVSVSKSGVFVAYACMIFGIVVFEIFRELYIQKEGI